MHSVTSIHSHWKTLYKFESIIQFKQPKIVYNWSKNISWAYSLVENKRRGFLPFLKHF